MSWNHGRFSSRLKGLSSDNVPRTDLTFVIRSRPTFGGKRWMPWFVSSETSPPMLFTSHPAHLIDGLVGSNPLYSETNPHNLIKYKETSSSVALRTWAPKYSSFTFEVAETDYTFGHMKQLPKGMIVEVFAGFADFEWHEYERINLGVVRQISRESGTYRVQCDEIFTVMTSPGVFDSASFPNVPLSFSGAGGTFTMNELYSNNDDNFNIVSGPEGPIQFAGDLRSSKHRMVVELPDNDEPTTKNVYLRINIDPSTTTRLVRKAKTAATTGADYYPTDYFKQTIGAVSSFGWSCIPYAGTGRVMYCPNSSSPQDGFLDAFTRILTSTGKYGTGDQNGEYDTLDKVLGFGFPHELFDRDDAKTWHKRWADRDLDALTWTPFFTTESESGWTVIQKALKNFGMWITMKEGDYTLRSAVSHSEDLEGSNHSAVVKTEDIIEIRKHDWFHNSARIEHSGVQYATKTGLVTPTAAEENEVDTRPFAGKVTRSTVNGPLIYSGAMSPDVTTCWKWNEATGTNSSKVFVTLQSGWFTRVPELVEVEVAGLWFGRLCPGDTVLVNCSQIVGPEGPWSNRPAMVQSIQRDWMRGRVTLQLAALPTSPNRYK